ncbi:hypothetical protein [Oceanobacillus kimchii]|uniref:Uncharacterized protein n=1 Tax=Oceanobacillus kimchii TaxID=746691 RepID=A0ABQ5TJF2_9BACI|nr:hypothetical protein [Oceanobacillus kimchii]GLO66287.1 hypothetical protein MACH08_20710 [Oceanobacillus kimchii]
MLTYKEIIDIESLLKLLGKSIDDKKEFERVQYMLEMSLNNIENKIDEKDELNKYFKEGLIDGLKSISKACKFDTKIIDQVLNRL